jgi:hypothetical protein
MLTDPILLLSMALFLTSRVQAGGFGFQLKDKWVGNDFLGGTWTFETEDDPTHGVVDYVDQTTALALNLTYGVHAR